MPSKDFLALNPGFAAADMPGANRRRTLRDLGWTDEAITAAVERVKGAVTTPPGATM